ncbi:MAG: AMP-binding protein [Planctomycetota bacterium]
MTAYPWPLGRLNHLLEQARARPFYGARLTGLPPSIESLDQWRNIPLLNKHELQGEGQNGVATVFDRPRTDYVRFHQTSGTTGHPMVVLDTQDDWSWWLDCWDKVLDAAEVKSNDVAMMAFSFGPFIGFWTAAEAMTRRGILTIPGGGLSSVARARMIVEQQCTVVCLTPTYGLHLIEVAKEHGLNLRGSRVRCLIVAGEPGGSVPSVRKLLEDGFGSSVIDHVGASEIGAWGYGNEQGSGIFVNEDEFFAELISVQNQSPLDVTSQHTSEGELVLTSLGRLGGPVIRYRTGDLVNAEKTQDGRLFLHGGVIGRIDDMMTIRGVNIFPSSIEAIVRELFSEAEFRIHRSRRGQMDQLHVEVEGTSQQAETLQSELSVRLAIRTQVDSVAKGSLPRFEAKARRVIDDS